MKKIIFLLFIIFISNTLVGCSEPAPNEPVVKGIEDGEVYGEAVSITLDNKEEDVMYEAKIDDEEYELGSGYKEEGEHTLVVTATREDKTTEVIVNFEIDTVLPEVPSMTGVEENKIYFKSVNIGIEEVEGVTYEATIDGENYELNSSYEKEGEHVFKLVATKEKNDLSVEKKIPFRIDNRTYTQKEVDYFTEISLGAEYGGSPYVKKWLSNVKVKVGGNPTPEDMDKLKEVLGQLNEMIPDIQLDIVENNENINMYFVPQGDFDKYIPGVVKGNWAFFRYYTKGEGEINKAIITIGTFGSTQEDRDHFIIEEMTQALGMAKDSPKYEDSIFHETESSGASNEVYSDLDKKVIEILYRKDIEVGMDKQEVLNVLDDRIVTE